MGEGIARRRKNTMKRTKMTEKQLLRWENFWLCAIALEILAILALFPTTA